jgi:hypothetical protein
MPNNKNMISAGKGKEGRGNGPDPLERNENYRFKE